jgi:hypothetical protein
MCSHAHQRTSHSGARLTVLYRAHAGRAVRRLPDGDKWSYEAKLDYYRCLAARRSNGVVLVAPRGLRLGGGRDEGQEEKHDQLHVLSVV